MLDPGKFLTYCEADRLLSTAQQRACSAKTRGGKIAVRDYFIVHLGLATGLRVMEIAALKCGDVFLNDNICSLIVRKGKGSKARRVLFKGPFRQHCEEYLEWKRNINESLAKEAPLIVSSNTGGHMTTRAIEKVFKRCAVMAKLQSRFSIHSLRHTYASLLLEASDGNIRFVQKQLGHSNITTTQIYADIMASTTKRTLDRFPV